MRAPSFYSDPHVQFLSQLLEEIGDGGLQVPRFQRPLVWNWERRLELLRSIRDGIPIGAIMVWRTSSVVIECYQKLGPHVLTPPPAGATRQYILDGVQRLSTLYGALHRPPLGNVIVDRDQLEESAVETAQRDEDIAPDETGAFDVFFDPRQSDFVSPEMADTLPGPLMPIHLVFDSVALLRYQRNLADDDQAVKATDQLAKAFREYKVPVIPITTDDINLATRTFQRINSQGEPMTEGHMVHALTWNTDFDLQAKLIELKEAILAPVGWANLDDDPILKACKAAFGLDVYKTNAQEFSTALLGHPDTLTDVVRAVSRTAEFLWEDCGVPSPDLVPYALQIVVLAEAFRVNPLPSQRVRQLLSSWFWMTTYGELFAGMSGDRVQLAISDVHATVSQEVGTWTWKRPFEQRPLRQTFDFRAARAKAFAFRLANVQDDTLGGRTGTRILADAGRKGLAQVIPWSAGRKQAFSSPGNRFVVAPVQFHEFRDALLSNSLSDLDREAHIISDLALHHLKSQNYAAFASQRSDDIVAAETAFLAPLLRDFGVQTTEGRASVIDRILSSDFVTLVDRSGDEGFTIRLGSLQTLISIALRQRDDWWFFDVSHAIHTPLQAGPYWTSRPYDDTQTDALRRAISGLESYYREAVNQGLPPQESWLVKG